jgi:hypothetical protein
LQEFLLTLRTEWVDGNRLNEMRGERLANWTAIYPLVDQCPAQPLGGGPRSLLLASKPAYPFLLWHPRLLRLGESSYCALDPSRTTRTDGRGPLLDHTEPHLELRDRFLRGKWRRGSASTKSPVGCGRRETRGEPRRKTPRHQADRISRAKKVDDSIF